VIRIFRIGEKHVMKWLLDEIDEHWMNFHKKTSLKSTKGQLISEEHFGVFKSPKKQTKFSEGFLH
jgi:hypothetical protein